MIISKQSAHYRVAKFFWRWSFSKGWEPDSQTLCSYFWWVIFASPISSISAILVVAGCAVFAALAVGCAVGLLVLSMAGLNDGQYALGVSSFLIQCAIWYVAVHLFVMKRKFDELNIPIPTMPFAAVTAEYLKGVKGRFCPLVELVD